MTANTALNALTEAMILVMILSLPPIAVASLVGIIVSLLQALTQVQEQTVSFAVKLIVVAAVMAGMAGFFGREMMAFTLKLFNNFPQMS